VGLRQPIEFLCREPLDHYESCSGTNNCASEIIKANQLNARFGARRIFQIRHTFLRLIGPEES